MFEDIILNRRRFLGGAAMTIVAAQLGMIGCANKRQAAKARWNEKWREEP